MLSLVTILALVQGNTLKIDPLKLVQAKEVWSVIGRKDNPVWPGWDARLTPILIYTTGRQDVLVNHPNPPAGFQPYTGKFGTALGKIWVKDGPTIFDLDGQNTSVDVNGVQTLAISDNLSDRRQQPDPYASMTMFAHEAFHVYQWKNARNKHGNELALTRYPSLSVENNVGYALESDFLTAALKAKTPAETRNAGIAWLAARQARRKTLTQEAADYEDGTEFSEGLAKYVEYKLLECLDGKKPSQEMWLLAGFQGFDNLSRERDGLVRQMGGFMSGKNVVNDDLYGASSIRFRLYYSGMAIGALLDRLGADWKGRILTTNATLTSLAEEALHPTPAELEEATKAIRSTDRYATLKGEKEKLAADGEKHIQAALEEFTAAPGELVLDYSKLKAPDVDFSFTPFGILRIDDDRTIFRLIPIRGQVGSLKFTEDSARPILQDRNQKQVRLQLTGASNEREIQAQFQNGTAATLNLPGVTLSNVKGTVRIEGKRTIVELTD